MKKMRYKKYLAILLGFMMVWNPLVVPIMPIMQIYAYTERTATVGATSLNVRSGVGTSHTIVAKLSHGTAVTVIGEKKNTDGSIWYQIRFSGTGGAETTGYALNTYIKFPVTYTNDASFESYLTSQGFPESYKVGLRLLHTEYPKWVFTAHHTNLDWNTVIQNQGIVGRNLVHKDSVSSWKSIADGAYNWDNSTWPGFDGGSAWVAASEDIIRYYMDPRNFLDGIYSFQFLLQSYDSSVHTKEGLESMVKGTFLSGNASDGSGTSGSVNHAPGATNTPNNPSGSSGGNNTSNNYGPGVTNSDNNTNNNTNNNTSGSNSGSDHISFTAPTKGADSGVRLQAPQASISKRESNLVTTNYGPGMVGQTTPSANQENSPTNGSGASYIDMIMNAGIQSGVNPYVLASMIIQEQGTKGTSGSISGTTPGYEGYYNFFNLDAYQSGSLSAIQRGLWYASQSGSYNRPWNSVEKSILGGAISYGTNYVKMGQNTFYLKKFNVQGSNLYKHQYMTNIQGAASEGAKLASAYSQDLKQTALEFRIPIYRNMPENPTGKPAGNGSPNNKLANVSVEGFSLTPTFHRDTVEYDLIVDPSVSSVNVNASVIDSTASVSGSGTIGLQSGNNDIRIAVKAQNGAIREYVLHVVRRDGGPTYSGSTGTPPGDSGGNAASGPGGPGAPQGAGSGTSESTPGGSTVTIAPIG